MKSIKSNLGGSQSVRRSFNERGLRLVALLAVFSVINTFSMRMSEMGKGMAQKFFEKKGLIQQVPKKRGLLIFLDDSEGEERDAIIGSFLGALNAETCPIIVSTSLLYTLLEERKKDTRTMEQASNEFSREVSSYLEVSKSQTIDPSEKKRAGADYFKKSVIMARRVGFREENWLVKKINNSLNLLIPQRHLKSVDVDSNKVQECCESDVLSEVELKLGLKVNHMESIAIEKIEMPNDNNSADNFIGFLDFIFCKKSDYWNRKMNSLEWFIFITGHGLVNDAIAGLSLDEFKQLLNFLEKKINTQLLMVSSCQAMGVNSNAIFGNMKSEVKNDYLFPIIFQGINDTSALLQVPTVDIPSSIKHKKIKLYTSTDFDGFLKKAIKIQGNYRELMDFELLENIAQIKLPGIEWFSVMESDKKIVSIGSILARTRDPQKPLDVVSFFKKDPEIILLYTEIIPFELVINSRNLKAIVSMMSPVNGLDLLFHRIKKISSTQDFSKILYWFETVSLSDGSKAFWIDEINDKKNVCIFGTGVRSMGVYFTDTDGLWYQTELKYGAKQMSDIEKIENNSEVGQRYRKFINAVPKKYPFVSDEHIEKIKSIYPGQQGEQKYKEVSSFYPWLPSWLRSWIISWWKVGK